MQSATRKKTGGRKEGTPNRPKEVETRGVSGAPEPPFLSPTKEKPPRLGVSGPANRELAQERKSAFPAYRLARVDQLVPYANNARTHTPAQVAKIAASIKEFGFTNPVLTDGKKGIIAGHGRVLAAELLGMDVVPSIELSHLSAAQRRAYIIADNRLALDAGWDDELLLGELTDLRDAGFDLGLTGFDGAELDKLFETDAPEVEPKDDADGALDGKVCCPECGHEFQTVAKAFRLIAGKSTYRRSSA
jgi:hypothetical protein